jgi:hypothetical protein
MFQGQGDIALQRKMEKANVTIEKVTEEETKSDETPQNTVVEPNA